MSYSHNYVVCEYSFDTETNELSTTGFNNLSKALDMDVITLDEPSTYTVDGTTYTITKILAFKGTKIGFSFLKKESNYCYIARTLDGKNFITAGYYGWLAPEINGSGIYLVKVVNLSEKNKILMFPLNASSDSIRCCWIMEFVDNEVSGEQDFVAFSYNNNSSGSKLYSYLNNNFKKNVVVQLPYNSDGDESFNKNYCAITPIIPEHVFDEIVYDKLGVITSHNLTFSGGTVFDLNGNQYLVIANGSYAPVVYRLT